MMWCMQQRLERSVSQQIGVVVCENVMYCRMVLFPRDTIFEECEVGLESSRRMRGRMRRLERDVVF